MTSNKTELSKSTTGKFWINMFSITYTLITPHNNTRLWISFMGAEEFTPDYVNDVINVGFFFFSLWFMFYSSSRMKWKRKREKRNISSWLRYRDCSDCFRHSSFFSVALDVVCFMHVLNGKSHSLQQFLMIPLAFVFEWNVFKLTSHSINEASSSILQWWYKFYAIVTFSDVRRCC